MEGIGLENMLGTVELEDFLGANNTPEESGGTGGGEKGTAPTDKDSDIIEETAEVDFSDILDEKPLEGVGSGEHTEGNGETSESSDGSGTPQANLFSSIARILRDKGVFPDLSDEAVSATLDEEALEKLFSDKVTALLDERQQRIEKALNGGATSDELKSYQQSLGDLRYMEKSETTDLLSKEGEDGDKLRKQVMYFDYINKGFKHERALKLIQKSYDEGTEIEDAKECFESYKEYCRNKVDSYQKEFEERNQKREADEQKQYDNLKKQLLDSESFYGGVKVDKNTRQKAYDILTKPVHRDAQGNYMTALQKYQRENPLEFMLNTALMFTLTDGFKNVDKLAGKKAAAQVKSAYTEIGNLLNNSRLNGDGTLNLANSVPDEDRSKWTLAL